MITYIFISLFFICKAISDTLAHHYSISIFSKFNNQCYWDATNVVLPNQEIRLASWANKWKKDRFGMLVYDKNNQLVERFWGSSTIFVKFTDGWHLFNSIGILCVILAIMFHKQQNTLLLNTIEFAIYYSGLIWFNIFYKYILIKKT